jgi:hypothetical protein
MRKMRANKSTSGPTNLVFFDCETLPEGGTNPTGYGLHKLRFGCATSVRLESGIVTRRKEFTFHTCDEFWNWLETLHRSKSTLYVFAHNMGFDATIVQLWQRIELEKLSIKMSKEPVGWKQRNPDKKYEPFSLCVLDDPPTIIELEDKQKRTYRFLDTLNYWRSSLKELGRGVGIPKSEMPDETAPEQTWIDYCKRDVEIIEKSILGLMSWIKESDLGKFRSTSPSQALGSYRHRFMESEILYHDDELAKVLERESYYGGQVEIFQSGKIEGPVYQLDVTSLYPSVMANNHYPRRLDSYVPYLPTAPDLPFACGLNKIARVTVDTMERTYPVRRKDGVYHCLGKYQTTLAGPELQWALDNNHVTQVREYAVYNLGILFNKYVTYFWSKRREAQQEGRKLDDVLCKLMMNSLYGKFGQKGADFELLPSNPFDTRWGTVIEFDVTSDKKIVYQILGDKCRKPIEAIEIDTAFPAIASFVTSYGRERMQQLRNIASPENCYYQAVDALYTNQSGSDNLTTCGEIAAKELGKLNMEGCFDSAEFIGINNYRVGTKFVRGCIKTNAQQVGPLLWTEPCFQHLRGILREPLQGGVKITERTKRMIDQYNRGTVGEDWRVSPLILAE